MKAGIPLKKIDFLRHLLEATNTPLTDSSHLATYTPFILEEEDKRLQTELASTSALSIVFDGSTHIGEAIAIVARFVDSEWSLQQRLIRLHVVTRSLNGEQLAGELIQCISVAFQIPAKKLVAAMRDGAVVNGAALRSISNFIFPKLFDVICASHSLDNVGRHFDTPLLDDFSQWWIGLFSRSPAARVAWKSKTGVAIKLCSNTRWWSRWEVLDQLLSGFADVEAFLRNLDVAPAYCKNLLSIFDDQERLIQLKMQLAVNIDAGRVFVSKTYLLEGDGDIIVDAYNHLQEVANAAVDICYPNAKAVASLLSGSQEEAQRLPHNAKQYAAPALRYFQRHFNHQEGDLYKIISTNKALRVFCPKRA